MALIAFLPLLELRQAGGSFSLVTRPSDAL